MSYQSKLEIFQTKLACLSSSANVRESFVQYWLGRWGDRKLHSYLGLIIVKGSYKKVISWSLEKELELINAFSECHRL